MKKKFSKIAGLTLIEILIAIVISSLMMLAMLTSYTIVNSTYRQVTDRAKISQAGRDLVGQVLREIRMAGFKYLNDDIAANDEHNPIKITSGTGLKGTCDKLEIVYGGVDYDSSKPEGQRYTFTRYKITYECKKSDQTEGDGFKILKSKERWETGTGLPAGWTISPGGKSDSTLYKQEDVLDYVQDFVFVAHDEDGKIITSSLPYTPDKNRAFDVRTVDVGLILRSTKEFYKKDRKASGVIRKIVSLTSGRDISEADKYLRDIITVTANARNVGLE
tara:strand:+ start:1723 stop:2550 length:828 start_codon:yes stop_codon:yes gene_type:complete